MCECVFASESYLYTYLFELVSDLPDVWGCEGESGPFFVLPGMCGLGGGRGLGSFLSCDVLGCGSGRWGSDCFWLCAG